MTYVPVQNTNGVKGVGYRELCAVEFKDKDGKTIGKADANHTYPHSATLKGQAYPFPAFVKTADETSVHYGDWPLKSP